VKKNKLSFGKSTGVEGLETPIKNSAPKKSPLESLRAGLKILRAALPVCEGALNFLDFLVLFYQEKRTGILSSSRSAATCLAAGGKKRT